MCVTLGCVGRLHSVILAPTKFLVVIFWFRLYSLHRNQVVVFLSFAYVFMCQGERAPTSRRVANLRSFQSQFNISFISLGASTDLVVVRPLVVARTM